VEKIWDILTDIFVEILGFVYDMSEVASENGWFESGDDSLFAAVVFLLAIIGGFYIFREDENLAGYPEEEAKLVSKRLNRFGIGVSILFFTWVILLQVVKFLVGDK
jgi:hypothetical protein